MKRDICPLKDGGRCSYYEELPAEGISTDKVFFIYDSHGGEQCDQLKRRLELWLKENKLSLFSFDMYSGASSDIFCSVICRKIQESPFVIADISCYEDSATRYFANPNVMLEVGLGLGFQKEVILVTTSKQYDRIPSDISGVTVFNFANENGKKRIRKAIREMAKRNPSFPLFDIIKGDGITIAELFAKVEEQTSVKYHVQDYLLKLSRPMKTLEGFAYKYIPDEKKRRRYIELVKRRYANFMNALNAGKGEYNVIYDEKAISKLISENCANDEYLIAREELIQQIENNINYLNYDNFHMYLSEDPVPFNFSVLDEKIVIVESNISEGLYESKFQVCGLLYTTRLAVEKYLSETQNIIAQSISDKNEIEQWLLGQRQLL
ncbi:MAG: hypothetical protein HXS54_07115 [Theionarchaea archaeon]|nr:hypothetical protein [Theionarchaea archaeon]